MALLALAGEVWWASNDQVQPPLGRLPLTASTSVPQMSCQPRRRQMPCFFFRTESAMLFDWKITDFGLTFCFKHNSKVRRSTYCQNSYFLISWSKGILSLVVPQFFTNVRTKKKKKGISCLVCFSLRGWTSFHMFIKICIKFVIFLYNAF